MQLLPIFQSFKTILCVCPRCGSIHRLSDLHLKYRGVTPKTWLDEYEAKLSLLEKREEKFEEKEREIREKAAEKGRQQVLKIIRKSLYSEFAMLPYNPYDIKALLHPIDFVIFDGLNDSEKLKSILFLTRRTQCVELVKIRRSIEHAIDKENYDWKIARIFTNGKVKFEE